MESAQGLFGGVFGALYVLFAIRTLTLTTSQLGLAIAAGGLGALAGAVVAPWLSRSLGPGRAILVALTGAALAALLTPLAPPGEPGLAVLVVSQVAGDALAVAGVILSTSLRQSLAWERRELEVLKARVEEVQRDWWRQKGVMDEVEWTLDRALDR